MRKIICAVVTFLGTVYIVFWRMKIAVGFNDTVGQEVPFIEAFRQSPIYAFTAVIIFGIVWLLSCVVLNVMWRTAQRWTQRNPSNIQQ